MKYVDCSKCQNNVKRNGSKIIWSTVVCICFNSHEKPKLQLYVFDFSKFSKSERISLKYTNDFFCCSIKKIGTKIVTDNFFL